MNLNKALIITFCILSVLAVITVMKFFFKKRLEKNVFLRTFAKNFVAIFFAIINV